MTISPIKPNYALPPISTKRSPILAAIRELGVGDGREFSNGDNRQLQTYILMLAKREGIKVETRKVNGVGIAVKRIA